MISGKDINFNDDTHVLTINGEKHEVGDPGEIDALGTRVSALETGKFNKTAIQTGREAFPAAEIGLQTIIVTFPRAFKNIPSVVVSWDDSPTLQSYFKFPLSIIDITKTTFTVRAERLNANSNWFFRYIAVDTQ